MVRRPDNVPDSPGVYLFRDRDGAVMYVGKASSLRKRLANYFSRGLSPRTRAMVDSSDSVEWIVTDSDVAAIMLEYSLIQRHKPRFNIRLKDDKSFPYLAISRNQQWPRASVMRGKRRKGTQYFGPYAHAYSIRQTLDLLVRTFPVRTCTDTKFNRHEAIGKPCLLFHIDRCSGPCVGEVSADEYQGHVDAMADFLDGDSDAVVERLRAEMHGAADALEYETAARRRDQITAVERALARQEVVSRQKEDFDLIAVEADDLEAALVVLHVKRGKVVGRVATVIDRVEDVTDEELIGVMVRQLYGAESPPPSILVQAMPTDSDTWERWLAARRGSTVRLRVPQRGPKRRLMDTTHANAREVFTQHRLKRHKDHNSRAKALRSLQEHLGMADSPLRIECYDISTIQGTDTVGSMVVFEDGLPRKSEYRKFKVKTLSGQDDFAAMEEVLRRRFTAYLADQQRPVDERGKFAYAPSLVLIDGGAGQLGRAVKVLDELKLDIAVAGLAKKMEEVYLPGRSEPLRIPRGEEALYILQRVRDEAHRFAVTYHRTLRGKRMVDSVLDDVPGVGPARKKALLKRFGSLKRLREADVDALVEVVPTQVATDLYNVLHG